MTKTKMQAIIAVIAGLVLAFFGGIGTNIALNPHKDGEVDVNISTNPQIELSDEQVPALVTNKSGETVEVSEETPLVLDTSEGKIEITSVPTVEWVESPEVTDCPEGEEECGKGAFIYAPTDTWQNFKSAAFGQCWNTDGAYGAQCWDMADVFWQNYAGRRLSTCKTGAAKGIWLADGCKEQNAGDQFDLGYDFTQIKPGDIVVFKNGTFGHIGMAVGYYNNGYVALLGQNQGGGWCSGGGAAANIINIRVSADTFAGYFRPKTYVTPEPTPAPTLEDNTPIPVTGCVEWGVKRGDTMGKIMIECEGTLHYGEVMDAYAKSWYSRYYKPGQSVYDGWHSKTGVGLYAGDTIDHKTN